MSEFAPHARPRPSSTPTPPNAAAPHSGQPESASVADEVVAAGPFGAWLARMRDSLRGDGGTDVPCGDCVGCCVSSYYIPVRPGDALARLRIPPAMLVRAAGQPPGSAMMKYKDDGLCPMLSDCKCTIYDVRPQTCRDYDCRIFAAAGFDAGGPDKHVINRRVRAWRFSYPTADDEASHRAVLAAARFIQTKRDAFPSNRAPTAATGIAVLAIKSYGVFLEAAASPANDAATALAIIEASRKFDAGG